MIQIQHWVKGLFQQVFLSLFLFFKKSDIQYWKFPDNFGRAHSGNYRIWTCLFYVSRHVVKHTDHFLKYMLKLNWGERQHSYAFNFINEGILEKKMVQTIGRKQSEFPQSTYSYVLGFLEAGTKLSFHIKELWKIPSQNSLFSGMCAICNTTARNYMGITGREFFFF